MRVAIFDIESDGLLDTVTEVHCIGVKLLIDAEPQDTVCYSSRPIKGSVGTLEECYELLKGCDVVVGHNIIGFDLPCIKYLSSEDIWAECKVYDTLLASKLAYPNMLIIDSNNKKLGNLKGSHSLKSWGIRLGNHKDHYEDWSKLTEEMVEYCKQDVNVTYALYKRLLSKEIPDEAMWLEQEFAKIIQRQEAYGVLFDVPKAKALHVELIDDLEQSLIRLSEVFKPMKDWKPLPDHSEFNKNGSLNKNRLNQIAVGACYNDDMEWGKWETLEFNPNSGRHIVRWVDTLYGKQKWTLTDKGFEKTGESELLVMFKDKEWAQPLVHYINVKKLLGQLAEGKNAWLRLVKSDNRIHGSVDTLGAVSRRCTHRNPNMAQVPSVRAFKGEECRSLFIAPKGKKIVGCDASGLELRTLSHYMARYDRGRYGKAVDEGDNSKGTDVHTLNQKSAGLPTRDDAKTFIYAFLYGAGVDKLGSITGGGAREGTILRKRFLTKLPALELLITSVQKAVKERGTLKGLDGNKFFIRSEHSALNTLLQGAGALVMKYYNIAVDENFQKQGWIWGEDYAQVLSVHDECQWEVNEELVERFKKIAEDSFNDVTSRLDFRIPLRGEAKSGDSWKETH